MTKPGDLQYYARVHCYQAIRRHFPHDLARLSLLPLAMRMAGPREALWHAIVHQNYGCSHMIVGPKHAYPPPGNGHAFYEPDQAKELVLKYADQLKITAVPIEAMQYVPDKQRFMPVSEIQKQKLESIEYTDAS